MTTALLFKIPSRRQQLSALRSRAWSMSRLFVYEDRDPMSATYRGLQIVDSRTKAVIVGAGYTLTLRGVHQSLDRLECQWVLRPALAA